MIELNLIYASQKEPPHIAHENSIGKMWMSNARKEGVANIGMNYDSALNMKENDSILILEPPCIIMEHYNVNFLNKFRYIFTWATKNLEQTSIANKLIYTNFPSYKNNPQIDGNWPSWDERTDEVVFIANNKQSGHPTELYSLRVKLADWLHSSSCFKVSWYGNMPINRPYYRGNVQNKQDILRKVKFHVCIENCYDPISSAGFLTEKLPDAWFAGTVPIYMGCSNMSELGIDQNCYIDLLPFRAKFRDLEQRLKSFTVDNYKQMTENYTELSDRMHELTSYENVFDTMLQSYC